MKSPTALLTLPDQLAHRLNIMLRALFWTLALVILFPSLVQAAPLAPELKERVSVEGNLVTLADLFQNAGIRGNKAVFRSPDLGTSGKVSVKRILAAARTQGLKLSSRPAFRMVTIKRSSRILELFEFSELIRGALEEEIADPSAGGELVVKLQKNLKPLHVSSKIKAELLLSDFDWSKRSGRFTAKFALGDHEPITVRGTASQMVQIIIAKSEIAKGKIVSSSDLKIKYVPSSRRAKQAPSSLAELVGLSAKRRLPVGRPLQLSDLEAPRLIHKNQLVTILLEAPGLVLRTEGKALADATLGETLRVLNTQSKRIIHATAKASGLVFVKLSQPTGSGS